MKASSAQYVGRHHCIEDQLQMVTQHMRVHFLAMPARAAYFSIILSTERVVRRVDSPFVYVSEHGE